MTPLKIETGDSLLADFVSKDAQRIWSASWAVIKTRDPAILDFLAPRSQEIDTAVDGVALGGAVRPNHNSFEFALRKLDYYRAKAGCLCELYVEEQGFDPEKEALAGNVVVESKNDIPYATEYVCRCTVCSREYSVQEGEYHFTFWVWKKV